MCCVFCKKLEWTDNPELNVMWWVISKSTCCHRVTYTRDVKKGAKTEQPKQCALNKRTIKVCNNCSWWCPGTSVTSAAQQTVSMFLCSSGSNIRDEILCPWRAPCQIKKALWEKPSWCVNFFEMKNCCQPRKQAVQVDSNPNTPQPGLSLSPAKTSAGELD